MTIKEQIERKLAIRAVVKENMGKNEGYVCPVFTIPEVEKEKNIVIDLDSDIKGELEHLAQHIKYAEKHTTQTGYWELKSDRKLIGPVIIWGKKVARVLFYKFFGWYIRKILYQQTQYNQGVFSALKNINILFRKQELAILSLQKENERQNEVLMEQKSMIEDLKKDFEESLKIQREEYTIMMRYYQK